MEWEGVSKLNPLCPQQGLSRFSRSPRLSQVTVPSWVELRLHGREVGGGHLSFAPLLQEEGRGNGEHHLPVKTVA